MLLEFREYVFIIWLVFCWKFCVRVNLSCLISVYGVFRFLRLAIRCRSQSQSVIIMVKLLLLHYGEAYSNCIFVQLDKLVLIAYVFKKKTMTIHVKKKKQKCSAFL